jgi:hypothetical protein
MRSPSPHRLQRLATGKLSQSGKRESAALGRKLHSRLATMAQHMERVGKNLPLPTPPTTRWSAVSKVQVFTEARRFRSGSAGSARVAGATHGRSRAASDDAGLPQADGQRRRCRGLINWLAM